MTGDHLGSTVDGTCRCGCGGQTKQVTRGNARLGQVRGEYRLYLVGHHRRQFDGSSSQWVVNPGNGCWEWQHSRRPDGYGYVILDRRRLRAHRWVYEQHRGPIPPGLELDHLCRNRRCVNPAHLEAVSTAENIRRGYAVTAVKGRQTHCIHGHELTPENVRTLKDRAGRLHRGCKRCHADAERRRYHAARRS